MGLDRSKAGQPIPDVELANADGETSSLAAEAGEPLLVNLWATWCAPCVKELPTLQEVDSRSAAPRVIAVSQDMAPRGSIDAFLERHGLAELEVWHDPKMALSGELGAEVLPITIAYDAQGREVWRFVGDLDWTGTEAASLLAEVNRAAASSN
jgi:thiol-disulfide isomerase/thioredoxin